MKVFDCKRLPRVLQPWSLGSANAWSHGIFLLEGLVAPRKYKYIYILYIYMGPQNYQYKSGCLVISNHFPCKDLESSNWNNLKRWLFRVPGIWWWSWRFLLKGGWIFVVIDKAVYWKISCEYIRYYGVLWRPTVSGLQTHTHTPPNEVVGQLWKTSESLKICVFLLQLLDNRNINMSYEKRSLLLFVMHIPVS